MDKPTEQDNRCKAKGPSRPRWAWMELLRLPNLFTVPGDPLTGALLAAAAQCLPVPWSAVLPCIGASLALYAGGLLANDYVDREEDARDRPARPIPSGRIRPSAVLGSAGLFTAGALCFVADTGKLPLAIAALLAASIWAYNLRLKRHPVAGPLTMGLCRGLSLLLGAAAVGPAGLNSVPVWIAAALVAAYIAGVTAIARTETLTVSLPATHRVVPVTVVMTGLALLAFLRASASGTLACGRPSGYALGLIAMAVLWVAVWTGLLAGTPAPAAVQRSVGRLIRGLILIQAAICATAGPAGQAAALVVLAAFLPAAWLGKWFYGS